MHALMIVGIPLVAVSLELILAIVVGRALKYGLGEINRTEKSIGLRSPNAE